MMKKKSSILGRSESVRAPVSSYYDHGDRGASHQRVLLRGRTPTEQIDYMSEDGLVRHGQNGLNGAGPTGGSANKRVSFNRDVAVKRIPSILHHSRPNSGSTAGATTPAAVVVVFPSSNNATVSQIKGGTGRAGRRAANLGSLPPEQQQMLLREARNVLEQMESISCQVSRDSHQPPPQHWRYSSSPSPPPSPVLVPRRRAAHPPPVSRPLKRSESLAGIFYSSKAQEPLLGRDQTTPRRLLSSNSSSTLNLNWHSAVPPPPRVVKKRTPSVRTPLFPQKSNNSLGESSGSGSSGETSGPAIKPKMQSNARLDNNGIVPPSLWPESFSYTSASGHSTSTPSPISSLSSASSAGSATKQYFFGQDPALHSDLNENVMFKQPQSLKIFQNHHQRGLGIGTPTIKPNGFLPDDEIFTPISRKPAPLANLGTLERKKQSNVSMSANKESSLTVNRHDPPPPPPLPPKPGAAKKPANVTTVLVNSNSSSSSSSECGVSLTGEDADDDDDENPAKYPLILRATSVLDTHPPAHKPFFYGDRLPGDSSGIKSESRPRLSVENRVPVSILHGKGSTAPLKESSGGFMSTLLRRKSAKISIKPETKEVLASPASPPAPPPQVHQLGTEQRLQQKQRLNQNQQQPGDDREARAEHSAIAAKRPTRVKSFLALFMGRGGGGQESKKRVFGKSNSISTPSLEKWNKAGQGEEYPSNYKSNTTYY